MREETVVGRKKNLDAKIKASNEQIGKFMNRTGKEIKMKRKN